MEATASELLEAQRRVLRMRLDGLTRDFDSVVAASRDTNADDEHDPEGATIAFERAQLAALVQRARRHLTDVEAAFARVDDGTYGVCELCGEPIAAARLEAKPEAARCVRCASR